MTTIKGLIRRSWLITSIAVFAALHAFGQSLPDDLQQVTLNNLSTLAGLDQAGGVYRLTDLLAAPTPPLPPEMIFEPGFVAEGDAIYWSPSTLMLFIDDTASAASRQMSQSDFELIPPEGGDDGEGDTNAVPQGGFTPIDPGALYGTNLWLEVQSVTNGICTVLLHNTTNSLLYNLVGHPVLGDAVSCSNWLSQAVVWGSSDTNPVPAAVVMDGNTNQFFWAYSISNAATLVTLDSMKTATGFVNNVVTGFAYSNSVSVDPVLYSLNMGYDGSDRDGVLYDGQSNPFAYEYMSPQGVTGVSISANARLSITNLFMSYNPLTSIDMANCQKLTDVEFFRCQSLASVSVTNCPRLTRACFEACHIGGTMDYSGNPNLVDIRFALNQVTNIVFGVDGATGPKVRHLCIHDNHNLNSNIVLTNFYSLQELFLNDCNQGGAFIPASTSLVNVWAWDNNFTFADLTGQGALTNFVIYYNSLTNLVISGCSNLVYLNAYGNRLTTDAVDNILNFLATSAPNIKYVNLQGANNAFVSDAAISSVASLTASGVTVSVNMASTNSVPGPADSVTFVTMGSSSLSVTCAPNATIVWHCGNGFFQTNTTGSVVGRATFNVPYTDILTNYVIIEPTNALISFGETDNSGNGWIDRVSNLAAFPNLTTLDLWEDHLLHLDLTGCPSLLVVRVAGNFESQSVTDQWLSELAASTTNQYGVFYYNAPTPYCWAWNNGITNGVTVGSAAYNTLTNLHWDIHAWCQ